jgi:inner membrane protein
MDSDWPAPSFFGTYLPTERNLREDGFDSRWEISYISRNLPDSVRGDGLVNIDFSEWDFGVRIVEPVWIYLKNERSVKYSWFFLVIPFMTFFLFEILLKKRIHPVQYFLAGSADIVFYLLLLSLSEHLMNFNTAYWIAASAVTVLISVYSCGILKSWKKGVLMLPVLSVSYLFLFTVLQSEDYALLLGSVGLFIIVGFLMFLTRKVKWYGGGTDGQESVKNG